MEIDLDQIVDDLSDTIKGVKLSDITQDKPPTDKEELESFRKKLLIPSNSFSPAFQNTKEKESSVEETCVPTEDNKSTHTTTFTIDHKTRRLGNKTISTYDQQLKALKNNKGYNKSLHESVHARSSQLPPITFDAHCKVRDITCGSNVNEKRSYIELEFAMKKGFHKAIINKDKSGVLEIMVQFENHASLLMACKKFNLLKKGFRMEPKKYYRYEKDRVSTKEFKIVNVEKTLTNDEIYKAMENIIRRGTIYIRHHKTYKTNGS